MEVGFNTSNLIYKVAYKHNLLRFFGHGKGKKTFISFFYGIAICNIFRLLSQLFVKVRFLFLFFLLEFDDHIRKLCKICTPFALFNRIFILDKGNQPPFFESNNRNTLLKNVDRTQTEGLKESGRHQTVIYVFKVSLDLWERLPPKEMNLLEMITQL